MKTMNDLPRKQQGVALLIVMLIMALMTTVAATMSSRMFVNFNRVESQLRYQQAYWFALSVEELAEFAIKNSFDDDAAVVLSQPWAVRDQVYPIDEWQVKGSVYDEQACFNLNGLIDVQAVENGANPAAVTMLQRLVESQGFDPALAETVATSTWEFIDSNDNVQSTAGVEDSEYEARVVPHVTANGLLSDVSEWRTINGVSEDIYKKVAPFLCANPSNELKLNINTLEEHDAPLLAAILNPYLSEENAKELINSRDPISGWSDINSFLANAVFSQLKGKEKEAVKKYLGITSRFFESDIEILMEETRLRVRSLLQRNDAGEVNVVRRRFGGKNERNINDTPQ